MCTKVIIVKVHANTCDMKEEDLRGFLFDGLIFGFKFALHRFPPTNATDGPTAGKHASLLSRGRTKRARKSMVPTAGESSADVNTSSPQGLSVPSNENARAPTGKNEARKRG